MSKSTQKADGEQYCMHCRYWKKEGGRMQCVHEKSKKAWFANQLNGCSYFDGELQPRTDWSKAWRPGRRPGTFGR